MQVPYPDNNLKAALQKITYFRGLEYYNAGDYDAAARLLDQSLANRFNAKYTALAGYWQGEICYRRGAMCAFRPRVNRKTWRHATIWGMPILI